MIISEQYAKGLEHFQIVILFCYIKFITLIIGKYFIEIK